jgi:hypothetical protein
MSQKFLFNLLTGLLFAFFLIAISSGRTFAFPETTSSQDTSFVFLPAITFMANQPEEVIFIQEPGPGSRIVSPLHLAGMADPTFEQNLEIRIQLLDGEVLTHTFTTIQADTGERGPFSIDIPFALVGEQEAVIQVFSTSARDGGITHLSTVFVTLADSGAPAIHPAPASTEKIILYKPVVSELISGGVAHVSGFGMASFEQHLFVEILDENGLVIGSAPVTITAPDIGLPGFFDVAIPYTLSSTGPGRIVVHDPSPAFEGDVHLTSVEIQLAP